MSNSSIEGRLKGLQERFENEMRIRKDGTAVLGSTPKPGSGRRPRPPLMFSNREIPVFPPKTPHATETENRMREVYKVSGKLNVEGKEYRSHIEDLQHLGELGSGTCGHVVKMLHKPSGAVIAVKQMRRSGNSEETKRILMDLDVVVRSHDCPYIVRCLGCFVTDADVWICMELMASCFDKLLKRLKAPIPEPILGKVTVATVNALSYLKETHGVMHRDVKPSNILLDERGNIKLCDFGISGRLVDSKAKTRSAGCAAYMAPERIDPPDPTRPDYDIRADVWSLGISLVELATAVFPYTDCQNDFEVLTRVIADDPPKLPENSNFSSEFKSFVSQCLTKNYRQRPKYTKLLEHPFVVKSAKDNVCVGDWYSMLPCNSPCVTPKVSFNRGSTSNQTPYTTSIPITNTTYGTPSKSNANYGTSIPILNSTYGTSIPNPNLTYGTSISNSKYGMPIANPNATYATSIPNSNASYGTSIQNSKPTSYVPSNAVSYATPISNLNAMPNGSEAPRTPQPVRNFVTSLQWTPEQATPTPSRPWWASPTCARSGGGSSSQPASLESDFANHSPYPRRRTLETCASPPPPVPARRVSVDNRWRGSPVSSGNTSPIVLQRFYHQSQQRRSRADLHATPRHRSLSREHSAGRSPEPPPRSSRAQLHLAHDAVTNGGCDLEPPPLHERLHAPSPLLLNDRLVNKLSECRSQSVNRAEHCNGVQVESPASPPPKSLDPRDDHGWLHSLAGLLKRRLGGYAKGRHARNSDHTHPLKHRWALNESWSMPASPLPPRAPANPVAKPVD